MCKIKALSELPFKTSMVCRKRHFWGRNFYGNGNCIRIDRYCKVKSSCRVQVHHTTRALLRVRKAGEWRIQSVHPGKVKNVVFWQEVLAQGQRPPKIVGNLWGVFYVFHMNFEQSSCIQILVVDDHSSVREAVTELLNREDGFEVCAQAASGHEAVQLAEHLNPDIVVMDVSMPEMDGIEATTLIRQIQPDSKIIALSVHDNEFLRNRMHAAGAAAYISKDALAGEPIQAIRQCI